MFKKKIDFLVLMVFVVLVFLSQRADAYGRELTDNEAMTAERIIEKLSILRNKKNDVSLKRMFDGDTDYDITKYEQKLLSLGVKKASSESINELLKSDRDFRTKKGMTVAYGISNNPADDIIRTFQGVYNVWQYQTTYGGKKQTHVIFESIGKDPYLNKTQTGYIYNKISPRTREARNWISEIVKIYAYKGIGAIPILGWTPYELLEVAKPKPSEISSTGNATVVTLNTVVVQKFVFVWNKSSKNWVYSLSTNRMSASHTVTFALNVRGNAINRSFDFGPYDIRGDYDNAKAIANQHSNGFEAVRCIDSYTAYSTSMRTNKIKIKIHTPRFVAHMMF